MLSPPLTYRREAEFWRDEAGAARQEAAETVKRLENQEQHIASVLQKTAEVGWPENLRALNFESNPLYTYILGAKSSILCRMTT